MLTTNANIGLTRDDGTTIYILVDPEYEQIDEGNMQNGVYNLSTPSGEDFPSIGLIAFSVEDPSEWEYVGGFLSTTEAESLVEIINYYEED